MDVRARLFKPDEFYYPDDNTPLSLSEFYTVLEGYRRTGRKYELNWGSSIFDKNDEEVFSGDVVIVYFEGTVVNKDVFPNESEEGYVEYSDGCFMVMNSDGLIWELGDTITKEGSYGVKIIGNVYDNEIP